ncbi:MAG: hypothetical protein AAF152_19530 [Cyanobacteria bacterium P01_A01_bin.114]
MQVQKIRPTVFQLNLHALELATLISTARWALDGAKGELHPEAIKQLQKVVSDYDTQRQQTKSQTANSQKVDSQITDSQTAGSQTGIGRLGNLYLPRI